MIQGSWRQRKIFLLFAKLTCEGLLVVLKHGRENYSVTKRVASFRVFPPRERATAFELQDSQQYQPTSGEIGSDMIEQRISSYTVSPPMRRRLQRLRSNTGLRLLQRAKAHLWTDWLNKGVDHERAIDFLSDFIVHFGQVEGLTVPKN